MVKTHKAVTYTRFGEQRLRSLCNRSSGTIWNVRTLDNRQNVATDDEHVTCSFCRRLLAGIAKRES